MCTAQPSVSYSADLYLTTALNIKVVASGYELTKNCYAMTVRPTEAARISCPSNRSWRLPFGIWMQGPGSWRGVWVRSGTFHCTVALGLRETQHMHTVRQMSSESTSKARCWFAATTIRKSAAAADMYIRIGKRTVSKRRGNRR